MQHRKYAAERLLEGQLLGRARQCCLHGVQSWHIPECDRRNILYLLRARFVLSGRRELVVAVPGGIFLGRIEPEQCVGMPSLP